MIDEFAKEYLHSDLRDGRATMLWKLEGLAEYDVRRPLTPTGTNLLGLIKHLTITEAWYFGEVFGRPFPERLPWRDDDTDERTDDAKLAALFDHKLQLADMWATEDESRVEIVDRYRRICEHSDATIAALDIDAPGHVPWWPRPDVKLFNIMVHVLNETNRHAGHADILREQLDGAVGTHAGDEALHDARHDLLGEPPREDRAGSARQLIPLEPEHRVGRAPLVGAPSRPTLLTGRRAAVAAYRATSRGCDSRRRPHAVTARAAVRRSSYGQIVLNRTWPSLMLTDPSPVTSKVSVLLAWSRLCSKFSWTTRFTLLPKVSVKMLVLLILISSVGEPLVGFTSMESTPFFVVSASGVENSRSSSMSPFAFGRTMLPS